MLPTFPVFSIFAFIGFVLSLVPLYWQFEAWNVGAIWYLFWIMLSCLSQYFNSIVWAGNTVYSAPAWCEISIRITMAASVGVPAASLCINRRLYEIASMPPNAVVGKHTNRRAVIVDSFISGLFPSLYIVLQLVAQRHRFNILEDVGCVADLYDTLPTSFISFTAPLFLSFGSLMYCALCVIAMSNSRVNLAEVFSAHKNLTPGRFPTPHRLRARDPAAIATRVSTDVARFDFGVVARIPRALWAASESNHAAVELTRWIAPVCALLFFAFFGFAEEAREHYLRGLTAVSNAFWNALARIGITRALPPLPGTTPRQARVTLPSSRFDPLQEAGHLAPNSRPSPTSTAATTYSQPSPGGVSYIPVTPSPTDPNKFIVPNYQGWHYFSNPEVGQGRDVQVIDKAARMKMKALPALPRGRTLV
ncbi:Pheromone receptor [Mycena venus]|uniref:Pheromone receptor n=1 Tax=Mycena venus TaxID=2733690 RepID=A0A8H6XQU2_9AGAR|nr:Pheromone receptor [Mycena venus]